MQITLFYITTGDQETAEKLGKIAVENSLAACANIYPVNSIYPWKGSLQHEEEFVLILKTIPSKIIDLQTFIKENHPYEIPCIMNWNVEVNDMYGEWVSKNIF